MSKSLWQPCGSCEAITEGSVYQTPKAEVYHLTAPLSLLTTLSYAETDVEDIEDLGSW